ncbi:MAG TPA: hypothetical protein VN723_05720 [Rhizomicrobium sp.]|nr:hypothetical protein [Rhizomicrobium sp.]
MTTAITIPDKIEELPAMIALSNDRQRAFVYLLVVEGLSQAAAYVQAGYTAANKQTADSGGSRLAHSPAVQDAILQLGRAFARVAGTKALRALVKIVDDPQAKNRDIIAASAQLLDRSGFSSSTTHELLVEHRHTVPELRARIIALAEKHGFDGAALVGEDDPNIIDTTAEEVPTEPKASSDIPPEIADLF